MTKQEKLDIKLLMTGIKGSLFPEQWDNIVQEFPFVLQDDEDIDDDVIIPEELEITNDNPIVRGMASIRKKRDIAGESVWLTKFVDEVSKLYGVEFALILGVAQGEEENVGFYVQSKQAFYRPYSSDDGAISFASNEYEAAYLRSLGYVSFKELKDADNN